MNIQPALDKCIYEAYFTDGHSIDLTTNAIAEAMAAHCDTDRNKYVLLESTVDYLCNAVIAVSCYNQVKVVDGKKGMSAVLGMEGWLYLLAEVLRPQGITPFFCCGVRACCGHCQLTGI